MKIVDLAVQAGRKRQSPQTGYVHYCYEGVDRHDTIPILENFFFALALLRTRIAENVLEGKALLEKLLAFQAEGNFPVYLHEYPHCRDKKMGRRIYPALYWILNDFHSVLGELKPRLETVLEKLEQPVVPETLQSPEAWAEFLIVSQIKKIDPRPAFKQWDPSAFAYAGPQKQERGEPALTLYDLFMGQATGAFSKRALNDHPAHLKAAVVHPFEEEPIFTAHNPYLWGGAAATHSLHFEHKGEAIGEGIVALPQEYEPDAMEVAFYCNAHPDNQILIKGQRATTFQLGEPVQIYSKNKIFILIFDLLEGEGMFFGHLFRANRPSQLSCKGEDRHESYDWKISLRTLRRSPECKLKISLSIN
jgi:hypothetical protein